MFLCNVCATSGVDPCRIFPRRLGEGTPLTLMRISIDLALRRRAGKDKLQGALEDARCEADRLARLATRLLDLAAGRGGHGAALGVLQPNANALTPVGLDLEFGAPERVMPRRDSDALRRPSKDVLSICVPTRGRRRRSRGSAETPAPRIRAARGCQGPMRATVRGRARARPRDSLPPPFEAAERESIEIILTLQERQRCCRPRLSRADPMQLQDAGKIRGLC